MPMTLPVSYTAVSLMIINAGPELGSVSTLTSAHMFYFAGVAQAQVDARLARLYPLPFTFEVPELQRITTDLATYYSLRRIYSMERLNASEWPDRYRQAIEDLDAIVAGSLSLVDASGAVVGVRTDLVEIFTTTMNYHPTFHEGMWEDMIVDVDKLEDILDARDLGPRKLLK